MATVELDDLLSNEQTASLLGIKPNTLEIWRTKGKGPVFVKLGTHRASPIRYQRSRVTSWIEANSHSSTSSYTVANRSMSAPKATSRPRQKQARANRGAYAGTSPEGASDE